MSKNTKTVVGICNGRSCCQRNAKLWKLAKDLPEDQFKVEEAQCLDRCKNAPAIRIDDPETGQRVKYENVDEEIWKQEVLKMSEVRGNE